MITRFIQGRYYRCKECYPNNYGWASEMLPAIDNKPHLCIRTGDSPYKATFAETGSDLWAWGDDFGKYWSECSPEQELFE
jgi:hypothetical protein